MLSQLSIHALIESEALVEGLLRSLDHDRYRLTCHQALPDFIEAINTPEQPPDCLIIQASTDLWSAFQELVQRGHLLPTVILTPAIAAVMAQATGVSAQESLGTEASPDRGRVTTGEVDPRNPTDKATPALAEPLYHPAEVWQPQGDHQTLNQAIDRAIVQFLQLSPLTHLTGFAATAPPANHRNSRQLLVQQQQRLSEKLQERLGYLGVYYKRDPKQFLRHLPPPEAQELWSALRCLYRDIVLHYFEDSSQLNSLIDEFVNLTFFADIPVTNVVELHMELMDEFSKQLKMEGRSEEILLDYRLTLIDTIAHLCEMYRRSIPRES